MSINETRERSADAATVAASTAAATQPDASSGRDKFIRAIARSIPYAIYTTDAEGRLTFYNESAAALWGRRPKIGEDWRTGPWRLFGATGIPLKHEECPIAIALNTGLPAWGREFVAERPDGTRVPYVAYPTPLFDKSGKLLGAVDMLVDMTRQKQDENASQRLAAIVESAEDAIISKDLNGTIESWNEAAARLFGYTAEEMVGRSILTLIPPDRHHEEEMILVRIRKGERIKHFETVRRRKDGSLVDISLTVSPVLDGQGRVVGASKIARDISEKFRSEKLLREQAERLHALHEEAMREIERRQRAETARELLVNEIKHRIKNTLATVQVFARQSFRDAPIASRRAFMARLQTLAEAHDLLTQQHWQSADVRDVFERALRPFGERIAYSGPSLALSSNKSLLLSMLLHELGTNACKYGALSTFAGSVAVEWCETTQDGRRQLLVTWKEMGGPPVSEPARKGFGSNLIQRALRTEEGSASLEFASSGVRCTVRLNLPSSA